MNINYEKEAEILFESGKTGVPTDGFLKRFPDGTMEDAYKIQRAGEKLAEASGDRIIGRKIGFTSNMMRSSLGLAEPTYGYIKQSGLFSDKAVIEKDSFNFPRIEPELAFLFKKDLDFKNINRLDILLALKGVLPSFEIVDTRLNDEMLIIPNALSDNMIFGAIVLGNKLSGIEGTDFASAGMTLYKNNQVSAAGTGAEVMGDPVEALVWLANKLVSAGLYIKQGDIVLTGSLAGMTPAEKGDVFTADFGKLGSATVVFK